MNLEPLIQSFRAQVLSSAQSGGERDVEVAERLVGQLEPSLRLLLLEALSSAVEEISGELPDRSVELRLRGMEPTFAVMGDDAAIAGEEALVEFSGRWTAGDGDGNGGGGTVRVNFRPPAALKGAIDDAAARSEMSINGWLTRAVRAALQAEARRAERRAPGAEQRVQGWGR